ncbi:MAG: ATP-binding cassette domain-containing protein [Dehalococcoidia bacterium]|nr:ATP-binding cassette domain-containing protein [Dehalococcoidia bacterium]
MLRIEHVTRRFGPRTVLSTVSAVVNAGQVLGVVGPNGSGKSTLLRIAAGDLPADEGRVQAPPGHRVAFLRQAVDAPAGVTAGERFPALFPDATAQALATLGARLAASPQDAALLDEYDRLLTVLGDGTDGSDARVALGVGGLAAGTPLASLSGGEQAKLALTEVMATPADVLLLDEPTNHLDLTGIRWLEDRLAAFKGAALVVSHDRVLLDAVADGLLVLASDGGAAEVFVGDYTEWTVEQARRREEQWAAYGRQQRDERRLKEHISQIESRARHIEHSTIDFAIRKKAKKIARRSTTLKARLQRQAAAADRVQRPGDLPHGIQAAFAPADRSSSRLVELVGARITAGDGPTQRTLLEGLDLTVDRGQHIAMVGPNGCGKSTLLRTIAGELAPAAGSRSVAGSVVPGYLRQDDAGEGAPGETPLNLVRREARVSEAEAFNFLHRVLLGHEQATTPLGRLSYGERRRLAMAVLMLRGANLLLLDEPTNHLDLASREAFEASLEGFGGAVVVVTHDRYLIGRFADQVWSVEDGRIVVRAPEEVT